MWMSLEGATTQVYSLKALKINLKPSWWSYHYCFSTIPPLSSHRGSFHSASRACEEKPQSEDKAATSLATISGPEGQDPNLVPRLEDLSTHQKHPPRQPLPLELPLPPPELRERHHNWPLPRCNHKIGGPSSPPQLDSRVLWGYLRPIVSSKPALRRRIPQSGLFVGSTHQGFARSWNTRPWVSYSSTLNTS
ncbi:hypothetical protein FRC03_009760 [Tulasnella sp. 419]|nr:hypothetical protein FRC03_009760 [Tulasnella sp. 419]